MSNENAKDIDSNEIMNKKYVPGSSFLEDVNSKRQRGDIIFVATNGVYQYNFRLIKLEETDIFTCSTRPARAVRRLVFVRPT